MKNIDIMCGKETDKIIEILKIINRNGYGVAFILNSANKFIGLVTDGDIRKSILKGISLQNSIKKIVNLNPIVAKPNITKHEILNLMMKKRLIYVIPVLNDQNHVIDYYHLSDFLKEEYKQTLYLSPQNNKKKTILIIGGAGYIGSVLSRYLLNLNYQIRVLDKLLFGIESINDIYENPNFEFMKGDYTDLTILMNALDGIYAVIHLAAIVGDPAGNVDPDLTREINQFGVKVLAELCKTKKIERFIFVSTCSVYGFSQEIALNEKSPLNPISLYAETKLKAEKSVLSLKTNEFYPTVIRLGTIFGLSNRMRYDLVINLLAAMAIKENKITIFSGNQWRPLIHIRDIARAIETILKAESSKISGEIFNVGSNEMNYKIMDLGPIYEKFFPSLEVIYNTEKEDNRSYKVSFDKIKTILGFDTQISIEDCLSEISEHFENNQNINFRDPKYSNVKNFKYWIFTD